ncbi:hypothetical protein GCM10020295_39100 [Streptomyces cinereospinus]
MVRARGEAGDARRPRTVGGAAHGDEEVDAPAPRRRLHDGAGLPAGHAREVVGEGAAPVAVHAHRVEPDAGLAEVDSGAGDPVRVTLRIHGASVSGWGYGFP